jgi:hypothetical protein
MTHLAFLSSTETGSLLLIFFGLAITIGLFMLLRSVMLWYWRINEIIHLQSQQIILLRALVKHHIGEEGLLELAGKKTTTVQEQQKAKAYDESNK